MLTIPWTRSDTIMRCKRCGDTYKDEEKTVAPLGHEWDEGKETKAATEEAEGEMTFICKLCGATKTEAIPKLEPKPVEPVKPAPTPTPAPAPSKQTGDNITTLIFIATLALISGAALVIAKKKVFKVQ